MRGRRPLAPGFIRVDRKTIFGNPVVIGAVCPECGAVHKDGAATLPCYKVYLDRRLAEDSAFRLAVVDLAKADGLACWCTDQERHRPIEQACCHAEVLAKAALALYTHA